MTALPYSPRDNERSLPRQQTLRATLDWSYDLLTPVEQRVLRMVGIFAGGWTLEAATTLCSVPVRLRLHLLIHLARS